MPAVIYGTLTVDNVQITDEDDSDYVIKATKEDGTQLMPRAEDTDGTDSNFYTVSLAIYEPNDQPGGIEPGDTAVIHLYEDGAELTVISPSDGKFEVGSSGSIVQTDIIAISGNRPPVADAGPDSTVEEGEEVTLNGSNSSDPDPDDTITYKWSQTKGTVVALSDNTSAQPAFTAPDIGFGSESLEFELLVTDSKGLYDTDSVTVNVLHENQPPVADAGQDRTVTEGDEVTLDGSGSDDPDDGIEYYLWRQISGTTASLSDAAEMQPTFIAPDVDMGGESLVFELLVTDKGGLKNTDRVMITVEPENQPPVADAGQDQTVAQGKVVVLDGSGSYDPDNGISSYQWRQSSGTVVTLPDKSAVQPTFTAPNIGQNDETLTFELTVTDNGGLTDTASVSVKVVYENQSPVADAGEDQTVKQGDTVTLDGSGSSDTDGTITSYLWRQLSGSVAELSDTGSAKPTFVASAPVSNQETLTFKLTVTDNGGLTDTDTVTVKVIPANQPPVADAGPDQTVEQGKTVTLDGSNSSDPDGWIVSYFWRQTDGAVMTLSDPGVVKPKFIAENGELGGEAVTFELVVTDNGGMSSSDRVTVNITSENRPPTSDAGPDQTVDKGELVTLNGSNSSDPDGSIVSYLWRQTGGSDVVLSNADKAKAYFTAPSGEPRNNSLTFELVVTDNGGLQHTDSITINIRPETPENQPPVADAGSDQSVNEGELVQLDGSNSSDPENGPITYLWEQVAGPDITLSNPTGMQPFFTAPDIGVNSETLIFNLKVTDNRELTDTDTVKVKAEFVNKAPEADAGPDQTVNEGEFVVLNGSGSSDPDNGIASYMWRQISGPVMQLSDAAAVQPYFKVLSDADLKDEVLIFEVIVTDSAGLTDSDMVVIYIKSENQSPVADAGPDQTVNEEDTVTLDGSESYDPDGSITSYLWRQISGTMMQLSDTTAVFPAFIASNGDIIGQSLTFELAVTDNSGLKSSDHVVVNIRAINQAPVAGAGPDQTVNDGDLVTLNGSNSVDPDGSITSYLWRQTDGTENTLSDIRSAKPSFIASTDKSGDEALAFELAVTDNGGLQHTDRVTINITSENQAPMADAGPDQTVGEEKLVTLNGSNSDDPDGKVIYYLWRQISGTAITLTNATSAKSVFTSPADLVSESLEFELTVTDDRGLCHTDSVIVNISSENRPPVADAGSDLEAREGNTVQLDSSNSADTDGRIKYYLWRQISGPAITLSDAAAVRPAFVAPDTGSDVSVLTFELIVTDNNGLKGADTVLVNITYINSPPTADAGPVQTVEEGTVVTLDASNSTDSDDGIASYNWKQTSGTSVTLSDSSAEKPFFVAPDTGQNSESLTFRLTVTDYGGLNDTDRVTINITSANHPPEADAGTDRTVQEGTTVILDGSDSSDPDDGIASYLWTQTSGYSVTLSDTASDEPAFVTPSVTGQTTLKFELTVTDHAGLQDTDEVRITIYDNGITEFPDGVITFMSATGKKMGIKSIIGNITRLNTINPDTITNNTDKPEKMIYGLIDLEIKVYNPGSTGKVMFYLPEPAPDQHKWYKYSSDYGWYDISNNVSFYSARDRVTLTLTDGATGDDDAAANGVIKDPSGLGGFSSSVPDDSDNSGDTSGCFITSSDGGFPVYYPMSPINFAVVFWLTYLVFTLFSRQKTKNSSKSQEVDYG
ncbi:MAG: hypothetical protein GY795_01345 [Desulfobacterales bacterium]|nr:hypothetical protein [Desulfobacterales bacterium]